MNAREAKTLTENARVIDLNNIYAAIERAAKEGDDCARVDLKSKQAKFAPSVIKTLQEKGFKVKRASGSGQRDGESWDYIIITW